MRLRAAKLDSIVDRHERAGVPLDSALRWVMHDPTASSQVRGLAAKALALADQRIAGELLDLFFTQTEEVELWETALAIECFGCRACIPRLASALGDPNPHRRSAAARALWSIPAAGRRAAKALVQAIADQSQPQPVREQAAESLAYLGYAPAIPALIAVLSEPDVRMRFWAVFALGGIGQSLSFEGRTDGRIIEALKNMLPDDEAPPGNWWPVGREALAMLAEIDAVYGARLDSETEGVLADPNSSPDNKRWAEFYGVSNYNNIRHF